MTATRRARLPWIIGVLIALTATSPAGPAAAAAGPCAGASACRVVARVDVDGDGRADQVALAGALRSGSGQQQVRVATARGRLLSVLHRASSWASPRTSWHGAARIDGVPGAELVLGGTSGAHTDFFTVYTVRGGKLVRLHQPDATGARSTLWDWVIDSSYSANIGIACTITRSGAARVTLRSAVLGRGSGYGGVTAAWDWTRRGFHQTSSTARRYRLSDPAVLRLGGWQCPGLPRFA